MNTRLLIPFALLLCLGCSSPSSRVTPPVPSQGTKGTFLDPRALSLEALLPAPPAPGSPADLADLETVRQVQVWRSPEQVAAAQFGNTAGLSAFAAEVGPWFNLKDLPKSNRFLRQVERDLYPLIAQAKARHPRPRPGNRDPQLKPCIQAPEGEENGSYPSGHALFAFVRAAVLAELVPERKEPLLALAHQVAWSRVQAGVHHPSDTIAGRLFAAAIVAEMRKSPVYQEELARCRAELAPFRIKQAG